MIHISKNILGKKLDGEWVFLNMNNGIYYGLNEMGSLIWDEITARKDVEAVVGSLQSIFAVERSQAERDLKEFLKDLKREGLIELEGSLA